MAKWTLRRCSADIEKMSKDLNISKIFACVLANRKIYNRKDANLYLNPELKYMYDAFEMKDLKKAIDIIIDSVAGKEKIYIYGDYDVDGVMSTVILYKILKKYGADVYYYIPDRRKEGFGLNKNAVLNLKNNCCDLLITCDNGIAALNEVKYAKELNMKVIIIDHHEPGFLENEQNIKFDVIPIADAVIDNKQKECKYPFKYLCAGAMSYKFAQAFAEYTEMDIDNIDEFFIFGAIATICDIVDLFDENRIIAKNGLKLINSNKVTNKGLKELIKQKELNDKVITEYSIGFIIGPCINASGRLENAMNAVELFICDDDEKVCELARRLSELNEKRKMLTEKSIKNIIQNVENSPVINDKILVIYDKDVDESIMGIVAGRVKDLYCKPTIVISDGEQFAKGSARSIEKYNMFENLSKCNDLFEKFGGHAMAAGLSLDYENIDKLRKRINENCNLNIDDMTEIIRIDKAVNFSEINIEFAKEIELMKPFGKENQEPIFATKSVNVRSINLVGRNKEIIQFYFSDNTNNIIKGISFNGYKKFKDIVYSKFENEKADKIFLGKEKNINLLMDIVYSVAINDYNNIETVQLKVIDFRI